MRRVISSRVAREDPEASPEMYLLALPHEQSTSPPLRLAVKGFEENPSVIELDAVGVSNTFVIKLCFESEDVSTYWRHPPKLMSLFWL